MRIVRVYAWMMARLNVYIPDEVKVLAEKWRGQINLSQVCVESLRRELEALEFHRRLGSVLSPLKQRNPVEARLMRSYGLTEAYVIEDASAEMDTREALGEFGAKYLNHYIADDSRLAVAGGRQVWCAVKNLTARQSGVSITATGIGQSDPRILHAHPNTIATILWLLYSPKATAQIITEGSQIIWPVDPEISKHPRYFLFGSCARFSPDGSLAQIAGPQSTNELLKRRVFGDYFYNFFDRKGNILPVPKSDRQMIFPASTLQSLSKRPDARLVLIAGGREKKEVIQLVLKNRMCNVLITDSKTGEWLNGR